MEEIAESESSESEHEDSSNSSDSSEVDEDEQVPIGVLNGKKRGSAEVPRISNGVQGGKNIISKMVLIVEGEEMPTSPTNQFSREMQKA